MFAWEHLFCYDEENGNGRTSFELEQIYDAIYKNRVPSLI